MALDENLRLEWHETWVNRDVKSVVDRNEVIRLVAVTRPPRTKHNGRAFPIVTEIMTRNFGQWRAHDPWGYLDSALAVVTTPLDRADADEAPAAD